MTKNIIKRVTSLMLVLVIISASGAVVSANINWSPMPEPISMNGSQSIMTPFGSGGALEATQEDMDYAASRAREAESRIPDSFGLNRFSTWTFLQPFRYFGQERNNTCGIASIRMVMHWFHGSAPTEQQIINAPEINLLAGGISLRQIVAYLC